MHLKKILLFLFSLLFMINCFAQEMIQKKNRINDRVIEKFQVAKDNDQVKDGPYQAIYRRRVPVAMGNYTKGRKTGSWRFYDPAGQLMQVYDYDNHHLKYEAKEYVPTSDFYYTIDKEIADSDKITKPIKVGGRYYGYLPYIGMYKIPFDPYDYGTIGCVAIVELLISPLGRLASFKVRTVCSLLEYDQSITLNTKLFKEEDRQFIPATLNGEPILSRIFIRCQVARDGGLEFMRE